MRPLLPLLLPYALSVLGACTPDRPNAKGNFTQVEVFTEADPAAASAYA